MNHQKRQQASKLRRRRSVRRRISGAPEQPRLTVHRSHNAMYAQLIDDVAGHTLAAFASSKLAKPQPQEQEQEEKKKKKNPPSARMAVAEALGVKIAGLAKEQGIVKVCFDRGPYKYHGRVKAFAQGARKGGLKF